MDVVTHALLGAALARATTTRRSRLAVRERVLLGAAAAAFPDVDFIGFLIDPLRFLADWHQGPTHSLVLLPLWAALIAAVFVRLTGRRDAFAEAAGVSALALGSHIAADLVTAYGTAALQPLSPARWSLGTTFVIDPLFSGIVLVGLALALRSGRRAPVVASLALLGLYVGGLAALQQRAVEVGRASLEAAGFEAGGVVALAQPFSPFNWKLVAVDGEDRRVAHVNLAGHAPLIGPWPGLRRLHAVAAAYAPPPQLAWQFRPRLGEGAAARALAEPLWREPRFEPFRRFAVHPALSRIDEEGARTCVWFTDLRYDLPAMPDTFRYGFCRAGADAPWELYRLRYFSDRSAQRLQCCRRFGAARKAAKRRSRALRDGRRLGRVDARAPDQRVVGRSDTARRLGTRSRRRSAGHFFPGDRPPPRAGAGLLRSLRPKAGRGSWGTGRSARRGR